MTTRQRIEWVLQQIFGDYQQRDFISELWFPYYPASSRQEQLAFGLVAMGVPFGAHETFELRDYTVLQRVYVRHKLAGHPTPEHWQKFIDEVISLVDGKSASDRQASQSSIG